MLPRTCICYTFPLRRANNLRILLLRCAPISTMHCFCIALGYSTCIFLYALHRAKVQYALPRAILCMPHRILCRYHAQSPACTLAYTVAIQLILILCAHQSNFIVPYHTVHTTCTLTMCMHSAQC
jgi:hypothetical protein